MSSSELVTTQHLTRKAIIHIRQSLIYIAMVHLMSKRLARNEQTIA